MVGYKFFERMKAGGVFINSSRGEVVDEEILLQAMDEGVVARAILDVWENEPFVRTTTLERVDLGTPHIAGYSYEGRLKGTLMVYRAACRFFEEEPFWSPENLLILPDPMELDVEGQDRQEALQKVVNLAYNVEDDDRALRNFPDPDERSRAAHFVGLRVNYPVRHEFPSYRLRFRRAQSDLLDPVRHLGFQFVQD
jgi:erythronate-4-phosphate dehydrogenase